MSEKYAKVHGIDGACDVCAHVEKQWGEAERALADYSEADWQFVLDRWEALPTRNQEKDWQRKRENVPSVASYQPGKKMALRYSEQPAKSTSLF